MIKNQKPKRRKRQLLLCMIAAGMKCPAMTLAVARSVAANRSKKLFIR